MDTYVVINPSVIKKLKSKVDLCKDTCASSYAKLRKSQKGHVDDLINAIFVLYAYAKPHFPALKERAKKLDVNTVQALLEQATVFLKRKELCDLICTYLEMYSDALKDKKRLRAYGEYIQCMLTHIDPSIKKLIIVALKFVMALVKLFQDSNMKSHIKDLAMNVHSEILKPAHRTLKGSSKTK